MTTRLILVDDDAGMRTHLCKMLAEQPDIEVLGQASDGPGAVRLTIELRPDLVLMDVVMPGKNGVAATKQVLATLPNIKVLALSMHNEPAFIQAMRDAGASGYVLKDEAIERLHQAICAVMAGETYFPSE